MLLKIILVLFIVSGCAISLKLNCKDGNCTQIDTKGTSCFVKTIFKTSLSHKIYYNHDEEPPGQSFEC